MHLFDSHHAGVAIGDEMHSFRRFPMEPFLETLEGRLVPISAH